MGKRPRIAFITDTLQGAGTYQVLLWTAIADKAEELGVDLLCLSGGILNHSVNFQYEKYKNLIFDLISPETVDGILLSGGSMGNFASTQEFRSFALKYQVPVVSIARIVEGVPAISIDNTAGMHDIIAHLVQTHGCRRLAIVQGPLKNSDALQRFTIYKDTLQELGIPFDPDLTFEGTFMVESGAMAVKHWLDVKQVTFDAVIGSNDNMALGAMEELKARGINVPYDVHVTGFDDIEDAQSVVPPLSTVRQPVYEQAALALTRLMEAVQGKALAPTENLRTELVIRKSCGCLASGSSDIPAPEGLDVYGVAPVTAAIVRALGIDPRSEVARGIQQLASALEVTAKEQNPARFLSVFDNLLNQQVLVGADLSLWQRVIPVFRKVCLITFADRTAELEELWQQSLTSVGEMMKQALIRKMIVFERHSLLLGQLGQEIGTSFEPQELFEVLSKQLPTLGIPSFFLSLYGEDEDFQAPPGLTQMPELSRLMVAYTPRGRVDIPEAGLVYATSDVIPQACDHPDRFSMALLPVYFRDRHYGYMGIEIGPRMGSIYESLFYQMGSVLESSALLKNSRRNQAALQERNNEIQALVKPMIQAVENTSRILRENRKTIAAIAGESRTSSQKISETNQTIEHVAQAMNKMMDVVGSINEIAETVNILGLNAAIESAHSGAAGKGFAVVANEIRKLSESTRMNAEEITLTLNAAISDTEKSVESGRESILSFQGLESNIASLTDSLGVISGKMEELAAINERILTVMEQ